MLKLKYAPRFFREHPVLTRTLALGYTPFICCFAFPLGSIRFSLNAFTFCGLMGLCLAEAYGPGRDAGVFLRVLAAAPPGMTAAYHLLGKWLLPDGGA